MTQLTANGNTYSDDGTTPKDMNNGGFRNHLMPMLKDVMTDVGADVTAAESAKTAAQAAATSAANAPGTNATSTTSDTIALGSTSITLAQTGKLYSVGQQIRIASTASPTNWMDGTLTAFNAATGAMTVNVTAISGSGTFAAWTVALSGAPGVAGVLNELKGANIASAATVNLDTATGNFVHITGTTTITAFTLAQGAERTVVFDAALTLTNGANLILPTGANIVTAPGDTIIIRGEAGTVTRVVAYLGADGLPAGYVNGHMKRTVVAMAALNVDCSKGVSFGLTVNANSAITFSNVPAGVYECEIEVLHLSGTIDLGANVDYVENRTPQLLTGRRHIFVCRTTDQGANWIVAVGRNISQT